MLNILKWNLLAGMFVFFLGGCLVSPYGNSGRVIIQGDHTVIDVAFSDHDRELIREYYGYNYKTKQKKLPPGLAKKRNLPPGIQKQLIRNSQLPPGLQYQRLPYDLEKRMSRIPDEYIRIVVDGSFVLFNKQSRVIVDIINDL